jgi:hypothetical protein
MAVCVWLKIAGVFPQFWFWTISYAREYASILTVKDGLVNLRDELLALLLSAGVLLIATVVGLLILCTGSMSLHRRLFLGGFFVFSFLAVCPGYYFRPHYFILLVPAAALMVGLAVDWCERWFAPTPWLRVLPIALAVLACAESLLAYRQILLVLPPDRACEAIYPGRPFVEAEKIARYIQEDTRPDERIAVVGSEPEIYFYAHRLSSTGYIYSYPLMEPQAFAKKMQHEMYREIENNAPAYLVFVDVQNSLSSIRYWDSESRRGLFDWTESYVHRNMEQVGLVQSPGTPEARSVWGNQMKAVTPESESFLSIYKARTPMQALQRSAVRR